jgi:hypothetical protein
LIGTDQSGSIAQAVDLAIERYRQLENRTRLEAATAEYFSGLTPAAHAEEQALACRLHASTRKLAFQKPPAWRLK